MIGPTVSTNLISLQHPYQPMVHRVPPSEPVSIKIRRKTHEQLKRMKKGRMTYDDLISAMITDTEEKTWDVDKIVNHCNKIDETTTYHSLDEVLYEKNTPPPKK